jgi:hypothetical protein
MATTQKWTRGTTDTLLSTELNSLANNTNAIKSSSVTLSTESYVLADVELRVQFGGTPTANTAISVWFLREIDGTNYEDGSGSITPARNPDVVIPVRATSNAQRIIKSCVLPSGTFIPLVRNDGTGQAFSSSGNTLKVKPITLQSI